MSDKQQTVLDQKTKREIEQVRRELNRATVGIPVQYAQGGGGAPAVWVPYSGE